MLCFASSLRLVFYSGLGLHLFIFLYVLLHCRRKDSVSIWPFWSRKCIISLQTFTLKHCLALPHSSTWTHKGIMSTIPPLTSLSCFNFWYVSFLNCLGLFTFSFNKIKLFWFCSIDIFQKLTSSKQKVYWLCPFEGSAMPLKPCHSWSVVPAVKIWWLLSLIFSLLCFFWVIRCYWLWIFNVILVLSKLLFSFLCEDYIFTYPNSTFILSSSIIPIVFLSS